MTLSRLAARPHAVRVLLVWVLLELAAAAQVRTRHEILLVSWARSAVSPVVVGARALAGAAEDLAWGVRDFRRLGVENGELRRTLSQARARLYLLHQELEYFQQLSEIAAAFPRLDLRSSVATCVHRSLGDGRLSVGAGYSRGIRRNMPVIGGGGLVGRVVRVAKGRSWIETVSRAGVAVAVAGGPERTPCLTVGTGGRALRVEYVPRRTPMTEGVELVTTGADGLYPPGIPVAEVISVSEGPGAFLRVEALPTVDLVRLQTVVLVAGWNDSAGGPGAP